MYKYNQRIKLHYPKRTVIGHELEFRPRHFLVKFVRDLVAEPLSVEDYLQRPMIYRGRWLVGGWDLDSGKFRTIYPTSSMEQFRIVPLRIGLYAPGEKWPQQILSESFDATFEDRAFLARSIAQWSQRDLGAMRLGIFADDLKLVKEDVNGYDFA